MSSLPHVYPTGAEFKDAKNYKVVKMDPDGNCGFRALAYHEYTDQNKFSTVKKELLDYMDGDDFKNENKIYILKNDDTIIEMELTELDIHYAKEILQTKNAWMANIHVGIYSRLKKKKITVYGRNGKSDATVTYVPNASNAQWEGYALINKNGAHYDALVLKEKTVQEKTVPLDESYLNYREEQPETFVLFVGSAQNGQIDQNTQVLVQSKINNLASMYLKNADELPKSGKYDVIVVYDKTIDPEEVYKRLKRGGTALYLKLTDNQKTCLSNISSQKVEIKEDALVIKK